MFRRILFFLMVFFDVVVKIILKDVFVLYIWRNIEDYYCLKLFDFFVIFWYCYFVYIVFFFGCELFICFFFLDFGC